MTVPGGPSRGFPWLTWTVALVVLAALLGLGSWQVERLAWKEELIATIAARLSAEPVPLSSVLASDRPIAEQEYLRVSVGGTFVHEAERHFFATFEGATGFYVYTPLKLEDGSFLFVNRGFVPYDNKDAATRPDGQVTGRVAVTGLLREALAEKPSAIVPDNDPAKNIFYWKDIREMSASSGLGSASRIMGFFVDADDSPNPGGLPIGGVTIIDLPNNHLQYAVTWFGLAATLLAVLVAWTWGRMRPPNP